MADDVDLERSTRIARVFVSAFQKALLPKGASCSDVLLLPTFLPLKCEELSVQLASLPKPIGCVAFSNPTALVIGYWLVPPGTPNSFDTRYRYMVRLGRETLARKWRIEDADSQVAFTLHSGTVSLSWQDYWTLREDYVTPFLVWLAERPNRALARLGYVCSVSVRASLGVTVTARKRNPWKA